jgi:hypothetical protein
MSEGRNEKGAAHPRVLWGVCQCEAISGCRGYIRGGVVIACILAGMQQGSSEEVLAIGVSAIFVSCLQKCSRADRIAQVADRP